MTNIRLTTLAESLPDTVPFVGPEAYERARARLFDARLGANENVFGPSPMATRAMAETQHWMYGDPESFELREALAYHNGITPDMIVMGEGIDGLLGYLVRLMISGGDSVVTSDGAYPTFNYHVTGFGGVVHKVPYDNDCEDVVALFKKAALVDAKLVYIANPDNPMGTALNGSDIVDAMQYLPKGTLLVLDEAYLECAPQRVALPLPLSDPRVIRLRTFSKAYGLAGARVGYAMGHPDLIRSFEKVRNHFGMNRASQAGALAALEDQTWLRSVQARIVASRNRINEIARKTGMTPLPSATNFVAIDCGDGPDYAKSVLHEMVTRGVFIRMPLAAPQNRCIRVSCGTPAQLDILAEVLPVAIRAAEAR
ncbi:pyridoxal phosphate-dependent aminotransferase [Roseobacter sp.]|uniref:pyridoxal phosphate-dependent aminotransferase n=1 Tax=Roseobacter sp. TaxID=1907202 RepID=UPI0032974B7A